MSSSLGDIPSSMGEEKAFDKIQHPLMKMKEKNRGGGSSSLVGWLIG